MTSLVEDRVCYFAVTFQVNNTIHFYTVPHNNVGNQNRAKVLSFPKGKLRRLQRVNTYDYAKRSIQELTHHFWL